MHAVGLRSRCYLVTARPRNNVKAAFSTGSGPKLYNSDTGARITMLVNATSKLLLACVRVQSLLMASDAMRVRVVASLKGREPRSRGTSAVGAITKQRD
jgi:hypothetical protein